MDRLVADKEFMTAIWFHMDRLGDIYAWKQGIEAERVRLQYMREVILCVS